MSESVQSPRPRPAARRTDPFEPRPAAPPQAGPGAAFAALLDLAARPQAAPPGGRDRARAADPRRDCAPTPSPRTGRRDDTDAPRAAHAAAPRDSRDVSTPARPARGADGEDRPAGDEDARTERAAPIGATGGTPGPDGARTAPRASKVGVDGTGGGEPARVPQPQSAAPQGGPGAASASPGAPGTTPQPESSAATGTPSAPAGSGLPAAVGPDGDAGDPAGAILKELLGAAARVVVTGPSKSDWGQATAVAAQVRAGAEAEAEAAGAQPGDTAAAAPGQDAGASAPATSSRSNASGAGVPGTLPVTPQDAKGNAPGAPEAQPEAARPNQEPNAAGTANADAPARAGEAGPRGVRAASAPEAAAGAPQAAASAAPEASGPRGAQAHESARGAGTPAHPVVEAQRQGGGEQALTQEGGNPRSGASEPAASTTPAGAEPRAQLMKTQDVATTVSSGSADAVTAVRADSATAAAPGARSREEAATPVSKSHAGAPAARRIVDTLVSQIAIKFHAPGSSEATVRLHPESLGKVEIRLRMENGHLQAQFAADSPEAREAIRQHLPELERALADARGVTSLRVEVGGSFEGHGRRDAAPARTRPAVPRAATTTTEIAPAPGAPRAAREGRLDLYA
ncbi:MAG: flagellar hook-length control protein FliK [Candidatus Eisenbacteria bacterium]|nr:flagellar hook-length control protein FliK [Candidatus Eisenbacteria bacterium]